MRERSAIGLLSRALQTGLVGLGELRDARDSLGDKWCHNVDRALVGVGVGVRSPAERDMRALMLTSRVLPEARWNQWLDLGDGDPPVCVDSLIEEARLVNEVEGRRYHAWANQFEDMHARHERLTAAGLVVLHPTPRRIRFEAGALLARLEQSYLGNRGRGLPPGVRLIDPPQLRAA
jgi:very-short-patch-repair endonuclease